MVIRQWQELGTLHATKTVSASPHSGIHWDGYLEEIDHPNDIPGCAEIIFLAIECSCGEFPATKEL